MGDKSAELVHFCDLALLEVSVNILKLSCELELIVGRGARYACDVVPRCAHGCVPTPLRRVSFPLFVRCFMWFFVWRESTLWSSLWQSKSCNSFLRHERLQGPQLFCDIRQPRLELLLCCTRLLVELYQGLYFSLVSLFLLLCCLKHLLHLYLSLLEAPFQVFYLLDFRVKISFHLRDKIVFLVQISPEGVDFVRLFLDFVLVFKLLLYVVVLFLSPVVYAAGEHGVVLSPLVIELVLELLDPLHEFLFLL